VKDMLLFENKNYRVPQKYKITDLEGAYALREGWKELFGEYPKTKTLALLWAQTCLETGRFEAGFWNFNFGNIKSDGSQPFTMFECGEEVNLSLGIKMAKESQFVKIVARYKWPNGTDRASLVIQPGHPWSRFRSYESLTEGAKEYIQFKHDRNSSETWRNEAYKVAFGYLVEGDPVKYSHALHKAGYYTAGPERYTAGIQKLFNEFLKREQEFQDYFDDHKNSLMIVEKINSLTENLKANVNKSLEVPLRESGHEPLGDSGLGPLNVDLKEKSAKKYDISVILVLIIATVFSTLGFLQNCVIDIF
jgi:hypothetical protein